MKTSGKPFALGALALAGCVVFAWLTIALPPWILEERALARLKSSDLEEREEAAQTLGELGSVKAIPGLLEVYAAPGDYQNLDYLHLKHSVSSSLKSIIEKSGCEAVSPLVRLLKDPKDSIRGLAAELLGDLGTEAQTAIPALKALLQDPDRYVQARAAGALFEAGAERESYYQRLVQLSTDDSAKFHASRTLEWMMLKERPPESNRDLVQDLKGDDPSFRATAAIRLFKLGPYAAPALPALKERLESDPDEAVRTWAACAILNVEPENPLATSRAKVFRDSMVEWATATLRSKQGELPTDATLLSMWQEEDIEVLTSGRDITFKDTDGYCRLKALQFLEILVRSAKPALAAIIESLRDPYRDVRAQAARTLGAIGPEAAEAVPALKEALKTRNAEIRYQARRALSLIQKGQPAR